MKRFLAVFCFSIMAFAAYASDVVTIIPGKGAVSKAAAEKSRVQAKKWNKWLAGLKVSSKVVPSDEAVSKNFLPVTSKLVFVWSIWNFRPELKKRLMAVLENGGAIVWQGITAERKPLSSATMKFLRQAAGTDFKGYACDPLVGKGTIQQYMFIKPIVKQATAGLWKGEMPPLFAMFAGEEFRIVPVDGGIAAGEWIRRNRKTSDGPAIILKSFSKGGASVMLSVYNLILAGENTRKYLPSFHSAILINMILKWRGLTAVPAVAQKKKDPINNRLINPDYNCPRSLWVWNVEEALDSAKAKDLIEFCHKRKIGTIYLYTGNKGQFANSQYRRIRTFLKEAHKNGMKVEGLDGWKEAVMPGEQEKFLTSLEQLLVYNSKVSKDERFDGFQSDVEPQCMKEYHTGPENRQRFDLGYVKLHYDCRKLIERYKAGSGFQFGMAVSEHLDTDAEKYKVRFNGRNLPVLEHLLFICDYIALMSYHDKAKATIRMSQGEVDAAARMGKKAWVGFETLDVCSSFGGQRSITFYEEGLKALEAELRKTYSHYKNNKGFGGLALHYYESLRRLPDKSRKIDIKLGPEINAPLTAILIDGKSNDWTSAPQLVSDTKTQVVHGQDEWRGKDDLSMEVHVAWDSSNIYFLAEVTDNRYVSGIGGKDLWQWDHLEIRAGGADGEHFQIGICPGGFMRKTDSVYVWFPQDLSDEERALLAEKIEYKVVKTATGYLIEGCIPATVLGYKSFGDGQQINLLFEAGDSDAKTEVCRTMISTAPKRDKENPATYVRIRLHK